MEKLKIFIKSNMLLFTAAIPTVVVLFIVMTTIILQSGVDEEIAILEAGVNDIPIIKQEDLDILGHTYSILNEQFEREINDLTTGIPNRHNKSDNRINPLTHYGVYGQDNPTEFKNNDYVNGIRIKYEKSDPKIKDGASNFNDIIAVMAILYDQKMDTIDIEKLKDTFTKLFWISHTYTYYSDELYPCRHGCYGVHSYHCTDIFKDYSNTNLKYEPFTVGYHEEYEHYGQEEMSKPNKNPKEDFRIVTPRGQCVVCGQRGAGCERDERKVCYHGGSKNVLFVNCDKDKNFVKSFKSYDESGAHYSDSGTEYGDLGDDVIPDDVDEKYLGDDDTGGGKLARTDTACRYYKIIKYCNKRKDLAEKISRLEAEIAKDEYDLQKWDENFNNSEHSDSAYESHQRQYDSKQAIIDDKKSNQLEPLKNELDNHISNVCEKDETSSKYWCDGYKVCLGHKTHYKCSGHKVVVCFGHTNINVTVKILYGDEMIKKAFEAF